MVTALAELEAVIARDGMLPAGCGCLVAVSGGRDSMVLLAGLGALRTRFGWRLAVGHFHHGLRGMDADADRDLVREVAGSMGLPVLVGEGDVRAEREPGESIEAGARRLRHRFLAGAARESGAEWIATGHHAGDQVELHLMRLLRGAGGEGLGGMPPVAPSPADPALRLARPLLGFEPEWVASAAREWGVRWREDRSNRDPDFRRNRVRHELIPLLEARYQPALRRVLERNRVLLRDQAAAVRELAEAWLRSGAPSPFEALGAAVQREVLRLQLEQARIGSGFELTETLRGHPEVPVQIDPGRRVVRGADGRLRVEPAGSGPEPFRFEELAVSLDGGRGEVEFGGGRLAWAREPAGSGAVVGEGPSGIERLDADAVGTAVRFRHWRPGDRFEPIGLGAEARLQDLFTAARVPSDERRRRVVAEAADGKLFWVEGLRIGERARRTASTTRILVWRWGRGGEAAGR